ncbi:MAG: pyrroline-5-carboxylate reductase [Eubacteriales bacterium]
MLKYGFIGGGRMASAMIGALLAAGHASDSIAVSDRSDAVLARHGEAGVHTFSDNRKVCGAEYIFLAVKPQHLDVVLEEIAGYADGKTIVSIVAGVRTKRIRAALGGAACVVRVMPNTPLLVGSGAVAVAFGDASDEVRKEVRELFASRGEVVEAEEDALDAVTALSGSGPAYFYRIADVLARAASEHGLDYDTALKLSVQTMTGAAEMIRSTGKTPDELIRDVSSPGGTTLAALGEFDRMGLDGVLKSGVDAAWKRSLELSGDR